jgi:tetratricopeptide (TPR) repeat protein
VAGEGPIAESKRFGTYLRRIREGRKLSLDAVEEMSVGFPERITKSHLSRIENGQAIPTFPRIFALSQIYGVPVSSLAERFEIEFKRETLPANFGDRSTEEILEEARKLRLSGLHVDALMRYEGLLDRSEHATRPPEGGAELETLNQLRLHRINCLVQLGRFATAKDYCEDLLSAQSLTPRQRVLSLQYFATCCYRLRKFTVAELAIQQAEREVADLPGARELGAHLLTRKGRILRMTGRPREAADAFTEALRVFEDVAVPYEVCRARVNLADALILAGEHRKAEAELQAALQESEAGGFERLRALALSNLAEIAYARGDLQRAEAHWLLSNSIARPREFFAVVFRNCFYLWKIAQARGDRAATKANERTLKSYLSRADDDSPEAEAYRAHLAGGES